MSDSTHKKFPEQLGCVATPTHGILSPAKSLHSEGRPEELWNKTQMGNQMLALKEGTSAFPFRAPPQVPQTLGHKNNSQITFGNRKHLERKHLNRIIRHLLFRPFQSISVSCALLENSEEKLLKCSPRPGWGPAAGLCQGCSSAASHKGMAPNQRWHIHHCSPLSPLTESPALAGY